MLSEASPPEPLLSVEVPPRGAARLEGLFSGEWLLESIATAPPDRVDVLARMPVRLLPGEDRVVSFPASEPPYRGRVTFEGEGVAARLRFSPEGPGRVAVTHSTDDGSFFVWLEAPGRYRVEAVSEELSAVVPEVEMLDRHDPVEIELPDGRISGVVERDGRPAAGVLVDGHNFEGVFAPEGGILSLSDLVLWGGASLTPRGDGMLLEIDHLAAGSWRLHRPQSIDEAASLLRFPAAAGPLAVFELPANREVELSIP